MVRGQTQKHGLVLYKTELLALVVMLMTGIREVPCSNLDRDSAHLEGFRGFSQILHENVLRAR